MIKKVKTNHRQNSWSDLPSELLEAIAKRLGTQYDTCNFRSVCKHWRNSTGPISLLREKPILHPLLPHDITRNAASFIYGEKFVLPGNSLRLVAIRTYLIRPLADPKMNPWLITLEEYDRGKVHMRHPLSRVVMEDPKLPKPVLELSKYRITELFNGYCLRFRDCPQYRFNDREWYEYSISKVVLLPNPVSGSNPTIDDYTAFVLYDDGHLLGLSLKRDEFGFESIVHHYVYPIQKVARFDDAVVFMNKIYVIDRKSRLYCISYGDSNLKRVVYDAVVKDPQKWRKSLVVRKGCLYLVYKSGFYDRLKFNIYKLDASLHSWKQLMCLGKDRVLFVTGDGSFFVPVGDLPGWRGNCIVFTAGSFAAYTCRSPIPDKKALEWTHHRLGFAVYHFDQFSNCGDTGHYKHISHYESYCYLFDPPKWLSSNTCSSGRSSDKVKDDVVDLVEDDGLRLKTDLVQVSEDAKEGKQVAEDAVETKSADYEGPRSSVPSLRNVHAGRSFSTSSCKEHAHEASEADVPKETHNNILRAFNDFLTQRTTNVDIRPDLVPTLRNIWAKHGDVTEGTTVRNVGTIARALESLAESVQILRSTSARSLNGHQVEFLSSALSDLHHMGFKVNWLEHSIEKALAYGKNKTLVDSLVEVDKDIARAQEMKVQLLDELAKTDEMEKGLQEKRILLTKKLSLSGVTDLDQCFGDGLC